MSLHTGGGQVRWGGRMQAEGFGICGRSVLPPSGAFQRYCIEVQPAETKCFCASAAANFGIKLSNYIRLNFSPASIQFLLNSFNFNAPHLPFSSFVMWWHLLLSPLLPQFSPPKISPRLFIFPLPPQPVTILTFWSLFSQCCSIQAPLQFISTAATRSWKWKKKTIKPPSHLKNMPGNVTA